MSKLKSQNILQKKIPFSCPNIGEKEIQAVKEVLKSGWLTYGEKNKIFEEEFARYIGVKYAVSLNSCTSALFLALKINQIKGEVIVPSFTFVASVNAIVNAGAIPVFADVDYETCTLDPESVRSVLSPRTEGIMVVHYGGQAGPIKELQEICKKHKLLLIEDSAEAIGAEYFGKKTGSFGIGCFSFFPTKNITTGEGGMLTTNDRKIAEKASLFAAHGIKKNKKSHKIGYRSAVLPGYNFRMSNILAAIGIIQLRKIEKLNKKRRSLANLYNRLLKPLSEISLPIEKPGRKHVYQMYTIKVPRNSRDKLLNTLRKANIEASIHFNPPVHLQDFYKKHFPKKVPLDITEKLSKEIISLPLYPDLKIKDVYYITKVIKNFFKTQ